MEAVRLIVTVHQPEHLPWLGLFHKVRQADLFVVLDSVPFRKNYFQNRNRLLGARGAYWATVPVFHHGVDKRLDRIRTNETTRWREKYLRGVEQNYGKHRGFAKHFGWLEAILGSNQDRLVEINLAMFDAMAAALAVGTPRVRASAIGSTATKSDLILDLCRRSGATAYLSGPYGRTYLDQAAFASAGVQIQFHHFEHPRYPQRDRADFVPNLSALDALMNLDHEAARLLDPRAAAIGALS